MATTTPAGTPIPTLGDAANVPADMNTTIQAVDRNSIPRFASASARDTAFPTPVANQMVRTNGVLQRYDSGTSAWVDLAATAWTAFTGLSANWSSSATQPARYRVWNGFIYFQGFLNRSAAILTTADVIVSVPADATMNALITQMARGNTGGLNTNGVGAGGIKIPVQTYANAQACWLNPRADGGLRVYGNASVSDNSLNLDSIGPVPLSN